MKLWLPSDVEQSIKVPIEGTVCTGSSPLLAVYTPSFMNLIQYKLADISKCQGTEKDLLP